MIRGQGFALAAFSTMSYILLIAIPVILLTLFLTLVAYEERRNQRVILPGRRYVFDTRVARLSFVVKHVDWGAFMSDLTRTSTERLLHDVAHTTLLGVRFVERQLTQLVRTLRARRDQPLFPVREVDKPSRLSSALMLVRKTIQRSRKQPSLPQAEERAE